MIAREIKIGDKFNKLTAIKEVNRTDKRFRRFLWKCDCGNEIEVNLAIVISGQNKGCGCLLKKWIRNQPEREKSPGWKGGRRIEDGYVLIYDKYHPNRKSNGYVREHTHVMSTFLGRPLKRGENVHHKNGDKLDNRIENLELWSTSQPCGQRVSDKIEFAIKIIEEYGNNPKKYE